ncbi:CRTAC1 family protein [Sulfitobacter sp. S190]|uniref:CRTAC1 family protein n=1 Tax=Sulfitobacter sp. S190 TaxID=2867022 RepID=UPI0021A75B16|nr:CRTAC1 family protein [Sulfitobacter sp. S190]UWR24154.1 CRTAC1 family protein [Sulfitobacter sp. S190]
MAQAGPVFTDQSHTLPAHAYTGGWEHFVGGGVAVFDCNGDALPDIFAAGGADPAKLIINTGAFSFAAGAIPDLTGVTGAYPIDMNADGHTDLFILRSGANVVLSGGPDCLFTDATRAWGVPIDNKWSTAFSAWWDAGQEHPTMAVGNYVDRDDPDGPFESCDDNTLLRPADDGYMAAPLQPGFCPLSMLAARDASGAMRLRVSNDRHYYVKDGFEQMWDIGEERFLTQSDGWEKVALWGMGIASRDVTGDGRDEVMLTSMGDQVLQIAQSDGTYAAAPYSVGTYAQRPHVGGDGRPSTGWHAEFGDIDNDGRADLFIAKGNVDQMPGMATRDPNNLLMQRPDGTFNEASADAGVASTARSRGGALVDFDGDGRLDLLVSNRRAPLELYRNETADTGHWLRIVLRQQGGNRDAIGAIVTLAGQTLQHTIGGGHAGGQLFGLHVGLGALSTVDVTVTWPDGTRSVHSVDADRAVTLHKP